MRPSRLRERATILSVAVAIAFCVPAVAVATSESADCGTTTPSNDPTATPYAGNDVWVGEDGVHYRAPGGSTPRREVSARSDGNVGVSGGHDAAGSAAVSAGPGGPCAEHTTAPPPDGPSEDEARCGKPVGGPVSVRPNNVAQPAFDWNDQYVSQPVSFTSRRTCATLAGVLYGPIDADQRGLLPAVLVLPPSGGVATGENVAYVARSLAQAGYIALTVDPQGVGGSDPAAFPPCGAAPGYSHPSPCEGQPFQRMDNWVEAGRTGLDFLLGPANPWATRVDATRVGATGHSLGARAASYLQDPFYDLGDHAAAPRVHAVVGLDNLSANYYGDRSASSGNGFLQDGNDLGLINRVVNGQPLGGDEPIRITAPGLGLGSDDERTSPDDKKEAFHAHRDGGQPSGMLIFDGVAHGDFSQTADSDDADLYRFAHYTVAWFDLWLGSCPGAHSKARARSGQSVCDRRPPDASDADALERLLTRTLDGVPVETYLSDTERSGWHLPEVITDCEDWRAGCAVG